MSSTTTPSPSAALEGRDSYFGTGADWGYGNNEAKTGSKIAIAIYIGEEIPVTNKCISGMAQFMSEGAA